MRGGGYASRSAQDRRTVDGLIDTVKMEIRLPADKLARLQLLINQWGAKTVCTKRDLLSLLGHLQHACKVVPTGRSFLRHMINTSTYVKSCTTIFVSIGNFDRTFGGGLCFWKIGTVLGLCPLGPSYVWTLSSLQMRQDPGDAVPSRRCTSGFSLLAPHITVKELLPIVMACAVWGNQWSSKSVKCFCDNAAVVTILNSKDMLC